MKTSLFTLLLSIMWCCPALVKAQDYTFSYIKDFTGENEIKAVADSLKKPLLITGNKIYAIGSDCVSRLLDGNADDRDNDGGNNNRNKVGENDERNKGGGVGERDTRGKNNKRRKDGDGNGRDKDGDGNRRDKNGDADARNSDGAVSLGTRCSIAKNGKVLLYTRQKISAGNSKIYYEQKFFSNKYFKIIQL